MLFSSWLRNSKRSAPRRAAHTNVPSPTGQLPPAARSAGRPLLAQRLPADQPGRLPARHGALHRPQPERLGHDFHAGRVFRCGQHVHHRAGHVLRPLRPRAPADDHRAGVGIAGPRSGAGDRAGRPPHRRRLQPDEGLRDLGKRQVRAGPPDLRFDRRHHQRLEPRRRSDACDRHGGQLAPPATPPSTPGWRWPRTARGRMSCMRPTSSTTAWRCSMASFNAHRLLHRSDRDEH